MSEISEQVDQMIKAIEVNLEELNVRSEQIHFALLEEGLSDYQRFEEIANLIKLQSDTIVMIAGVSVGHLQAMRQNFDANV